MKHTILHVAKYYYPVEGGIETVTKYLVEGLTDYENIVICFSTDGSTHKDEINGVTVYRVAPSFRLASQDVAFSYYRELKKVIKAHQPEVINIHCPNPYVYPFVVKLAPKNCKIVMLWHSDILTKGWLYKAIKPFETKALKRTDLIIATSPNYVHESSPIFRYKDKVRIVPNGVITADLELRDGDAQRIGNIKKTYDGKKIILFVGRHIPYKGIDCLIEAEKYIKSDCVILIAGRGPQTDRLKAMATSDRIVFLGKVSNEELRCLYHAADIFGFASVTKQEAFGVALAEAMYCRCVPVTFTLVGSGVNWVSVNGVTGEQVALRDVKAYAAAVDKILGDEELAKKYAEAAHQRVEDLFTDEKSVAAADAVFKELI